MPPRNCLKIWRQQPNIFDNGFKHRVSHTSSQNRVNATGSAIGFASIIIHLLHKIYGFELSLLPIPSLSFPILLAWWCCDGWDPDGALGVGAALQRSWGFQTCLTIFLKYTFLKSHRNAKLYSFLISHGNAKLYTL